MYSSTLSSKRMLSDIRSMAAFSRQLLNQGKSYEPLLQYVLNKVHAGYREFPPPMKTIGRDLVWKLSKLRKELELLYHDVTEFLSSGDHPIQLARTETELYISSDGRYQSISFYLDVIPREGERIDLPFFQAKFAMAIFYVDRVQHIFSDEKHSVVLWLKEGWPNRYLSLKKDQAVAENRISYGQARDMKDYELIEFVKKYKL